MEENFIINYVKKFVRKEIRKSDTLRLFTKGLSKHLAI
jgi:hypothetical protein